MRLGLRWLLCWRLRWLFCACLIVIASPGMAHAQASKTGATGDPFAHKNVLVLTSYAEGYGAQDRIVAGLLAGVIEAGGKTEDLHIEKLDLLRHTSPEYRQQLLTFLQNKYRDQKPDLIITTQRPAFDFARHEGKALFEHVPLIAGLVHEQDVTLALRANEVRLPYELDFAGTLQHALALFPDTQRVVMIGGVHPTDRLFVAQAQQAFAPWQQHLTLEWLTDGDWAATLARATTLPPHSIIVMGTYYRDRDGKNYPTREKLLLLGEQANAPIFSQWDSQLDSNVVVGGAMVSIEALGRQAALAAADFLSGRQSLEALRALPPVPGTPMFNWNLIERWNGQHAALPEEAVFIHRPKTLWNDHREAVIGFGLIIALLLLCLVALTVILTLRRRMEKKLHAVVDASPMGMVILTHAGVTEYINARFVAIFGYSLTDFRHIHDWWALAYPDDKYRHAARTRWQQSLDAAKAFVNLTPGVSQVTCKDGSTKFIEWGAVNLKTRIVVFAEDITERLLAERERKRYRVHLEAAIARRTEELALALRRAEAATIAKDTFLANVSHEIRTPLNAIMGMTYMALYNRPEPRVQAYLEKISASSSFLLELVNEILDYAKIDAGAMTLEPRRFHLDDVLQRIVDLMEAKSHAKGLAFTVIRKGTTPEALIGDPLRLGQVLINLCGNAVKFTQSGRVNLTVEQASSWSKASGRLASVTFTVSDTGIGIAPEHIDHLFDAFWQAKSSATRDVGGTGLGLPIAQRLVETMGDKITVCSTPGQGSRFSFTLSFEHAPQVQSQSPSEAEQRPAFAAIPALPQFSGVRVLVVEDNAGNQEFMLDFLTAMGIEVTLASNGLEGVQHALSGHFDLILMDVQMPVMDGLTACREIRAAVGDGVPILAMTAHMDQAAHEKSAAAGMTDHLLKPIDIQQFVSVLLRWLPKGARAPAPSPEEASEAVPERLPEELPEPPTPAESPAEAVRLAEVLHDLRSPLTSILGYAQMLEAEPGNVGRMASIIRTSANQMLALTKGLLPETDPPDASMRAATPPPASRPDDQQLAETLAAMRHLLSLGAVSDIADLADAASSTNTCQDEQHRAFLAEIRTLASMGDLRGLRSLLS